MKSQNIARLVAYAILIATVFWSFYSLLPKNISLATTDSSKFSTERALVHVKEMAKKPHFVGSEAHLEVRNYVVAALEKMGLIVQIQETVATNLKWRSSAKVYNILARIPGENHSEALMLLSHYDSSPHASLGASDAGSGVAAILEGVRAFLSSGEKPKNDIIILISDGEELGLLGAKAFVKYHPWVKDVKLVLNFEARGSGGTSYMLLETNHGNKKFIEAFSKANTPFPVSNSIVYSIYKSLPNDTDLTVFREEADIDGYNFAFIDDHFDYHTAQDSYERLDSNSLEHQGSYLMAMLNYFSTETISDLKSDEDYIFFNIAPFGMIYYPFSWIYPMLFVGFLIFVLLLYVGIKRGILNGRKILLGYSPLLISFFVAGLFAYFGWELLQKIYPQYEDMINKFTYNGTSYIIAFSFFTIAIVLSVYKKMGSSLSVGNKMVAPLSFWLIISTLIPMKIIGASYVIIPFLMGLLSFSILIFNKNKNMPLWWHAVLAFPLIMLFVPFVQMLPVALGLKMVLASSILIVLILGLLLPIFNKSTGKGLQYFMVIIGIIALFKAHLDSTYNEDRKKPNSIIYMMNLDENTASWLSFDKELDEFTNQFLNAETAIQDEQTSFKSKFNTPIKYQQKTELLNLSLPLITVLSDTVSNYQRTITIQFQSNRAANKVEMIANKPLRVFSIEINGDKENKAADKVLFDVAKNKQVMSYYFVENELLALTLVVPSFEEFDVSFYETKFDLLQNELIKVTPRTKTMIPKPYVTTDATIIVKRLMLPIYEP